ncbi:MAG: hypothetical protein AAF196_08770 [Planctomycetota bacterium]
MSVLKRIAPMLFVPAVLFSCGGAPEPVTDSNDAVEAIEEVVEAPSPVGLWKAAIEETMAVNRVPGGVFDPAAEGAELAEQAMGEFFSSLSMEFAEDGGVEVVIGPESARETMTGTWTLDGVDVEMMLVDEEDGPDRIYLADDGTLVLADTNPESGRNLKVILRREN